VKTIQVCTTCGSGNVLTDAFVHANDPDDVRTFDDQYCENCECSCKTQEVEVPDDFDVYSDLYKEGTT
jgi:transcription elongation factor Elf1